MEAATTHKQVTDQQLREGEEGLIRLLHAKHFPPHWIKESVPEIMSQARTDFAARLAVEHVEDAVNLLVVIAYRRAIKFVRSERARPRETSIDNFFHLADESTPTPEQELLDHDRQETLVKAMRHLPERERELLALIYFKGMQIGEAGRRLGWAKASASRHHQAALDRLRALVGDRDCLGVEIAIPAFVVSRHHAPPRSVQMWLEGAAETLREATMIGGSRVSPLAEAGNAAAMSGAGKTATSVCGAAVAVCLAGAASGVIGPGVGALRAEEPAKRQSDQAQRTSTALPPDSSPPPSAERSTLPRPEWPARAGPGTKAQTSPARSTPRRTPEPRGRPATADAPATSPEQTIKEFGIESGEGGEPPGSPSGGATENAPIAPQPQAAARPAPGAAGEEPSNSSGSQTSGEFGM